MKERGLKADRLPALGEVFTRLTVIAAPENGRLRLSLDDWKCSCSCGNPSPVYVRGRRLIWGHTKSCGCLLKEGRATRYKHHQVRHGALISWKTMLRRADAPIEPVWKASFEAFFTHLGERPTGTVLSRHDLEGPYDTVNCFWEPRREQFARVRLRRWPTPAPIDDRRYCSKCHQPDKTFYANSASKSKLHTACKDCSNAVVHAAHKKNIAKYLLSSARSRSRVTGLPFDLEFSDLIVPTHCPVFGFEMTHSTGHGRTDTSYSIDRLDNAKGYVKGNVAVISWLANRLKNDATLDQLESVVSWMRSNSKPPQPAGSLNTVVPKVTPATSP